MSDAVTFRRMHAGDLDALRHNFNGSMDRLLTVMSTICASTRIIHGGSVDLQHAPDELARRTERHEEALAEQ